MPSQRTMLERWRWWYNEARREGHGRCWAARCATEIAWVLR
jgi:hypothetical protein